MIDGKIEIGGVLPIAHTPFDDDDSIDFESLARQINWSFDQGANGFCTGMVSEILRLSASERIDLHRTLAELNAGRGVFVASVGAESTKQAVHFAREAEAVGATAMMAIPPISSALPVEEIVAYYRAIAGAAEIPLIIQDASSYVGRPIPIETCIELLDQYGPDKILFKPEAAPFGPHLSKLRDASDRRAKIFEGSGGILLIDSFRRGVSGTMPGMEMLDGIVAMWRAMKSGDEDRAYEIYYPLCAIVALQMQAGLDGFLAVEKYLLVKQGIFASTRRRQPYSWELDPETAAEIDRLFDRLLVTLDRTYGPTPSLRQR
ncbi:MAG: dihydrodipicolinate synthase family protein [Planctomycetaceae bacterium]|nr:dihydrodipicolinate synthase family protein [Planctomycetaceae bacterium]